jgi:hypothetical protein
MKGSANRWLLVPTKNKLSKAAKQCGIRQASITNQLLYQLSYAAKYGATFNYAAAWNKLPGSEA